MVRARLEVADIVRTHGASYLMSRGNRLPGAERRVLNAVVTCRTRARGGHVQACDECGHREISYNSCRNRHCPKCQAAARAAWVEEKQSWLLPVEYFHVVFTIPHALGRIALQNKALVYGILFRAASETLRKIAATPRHLGAEVGVLAVLHTWGQNMELHPHVHCIVPGGGLSPDKAQWVSCRSGFFLPVRVLSRLFRGKFLHYLQRAYDEQRLKLLGGIETLQDRGCFRSHLAPLYKENWVVYAKPPFGGPDRVLKYLARYTNRVAISNGRLVSMKDGMVSFTWKDYAHGSRQRLMRIKAAEFLRRFLLHTLPRGFVRIRTYGFLANRCRVAKLAQCRALLGAEPEARDNETGTAEAELHACPACTIGHMVYLRAFDQWTPLVLLQDSS
jgi:hypothetical protein